MSKEVAVTADLTEAKNVKEPKDEKPKFGFFKKVTRFFKDLKSEFKKIVWPSKEQVLQNTGVVIIFMVISAVAIWSLDWVFINLFKLVF